MWYPVGVVMPLVPSPMEDPMCWEIDTNSSAAEESARGPTASNACLIDRLITDANEQGEKTEEAPVKEAAPAK
jgi:hypothetical protein